MIRPLCCLRFKQYCTKIRQYSTNQTPTSTNFSAVFSFPFIKYISLFHRLKVYHIAGSSIAVPGCGILELMNVVSQHTFLTTSYIALTGGVMLCLGSVTFKNTIGFIYISEDNTQMKISSVDFWGQRKDRIIPVEDWIPISDLRPGMLDPIFVRPQLIDSTKYKWFAKYGNIIDKAKIAHLLE